MKHIHHVIFGMAIMLMNVNHHANAEFALVRSGKAEAKIAYVLPEKKKEAARLQACIDDFRDIIQRLSGAELSATEATSDGQGGTSIQVGLTPAAVAAGLDKRAAALKPHGFLISADSKTNTLFMLGSTPEGSGHALYHYLEQLGCRWYMPGPFGERLPKLETITVDAIDLTHEPDFELRAIQLRAGGTAADPVIRGEVMQWMQRNKFGGTAPSRGHHFQKLVPEKKHWESNPEFYALRDGKRSKKHLCMTNPGTMAAAEAHLTEFFTSNPEATGFPVALEDGAQYCECPACTEACGGNARDIMPLYLSFTGELFDRIDKKFPGREFQYGFYVYSNLMDVPKGKVPKQLAPYIAPLGYDAFHTSADPRRYLELSVADEWPKGMIDRVKADPRSQPAAKVHDVIVGWSNGTDNVYFRDYDPYITFAQNMPLVRTYQLAIELPWHKELGVRGYTPEATANSWFTSGINFWVRSRLYWAVDADIRTVMEDYCRGMFGAAWEPMYGFLDALARRTIESPAYRHGDHVLTRLYTPDWVASLDFYLTPAEQQATTEREKQAVHMWRLCQQHMLKYLSVRNAEIQGDFTEAASLGDDYLRFLDHIYTVNPHFVDHRWYAKREFSMQTIVRQLRRYADKLNGKDGRLLLSLPTKWWFRHDPKDIGVAEKWAEFKPVPVYEPELDIAVELNHPAMPGWRLQDTEQSWQTQPEDYEGYNWYRTQAEIPQNWGEGDLRMFVTGIFGHLDIFINGQRVSWEAKVDGKAVTVNHLDLGNAWSWNYNEHFDIPITKYLKPGQLNTFAIRSRDKWNWGGIFKCVQLYTTKKSVPLPVPLSPIYKRAACDCSR